MDKEIKTIEEARQITYAGVGLGNSEYQEGRCAQKVWESGILPHAHQCRNKNGFGIGGLYCKTHAKTHPSEKTEADLFVIYKAKHFSSDKDHQIVEFQCSEMSSSRVTVRHIDEKQWRTEKREIEGEFGYKFLKSRDEAVDYLRNYKQRRIDAVKVTLKRLQNELESI